MSETSENVQLFGASAQDVVAAAQSKNLRGLVIETEGPWVCFVPFDGAEIERATTLSQGLAMIWRFAADFGLWLSFYEDGKQVGTLQFGLDADCTLDFDLRECLVRHGASTVLVDQLRVLKSELGSTSLRDGVASRLGLKVYSWLSPPYVQDSLEELAAKFPGVRVVPE